MTERTNGHTEPLCSVRRAQGTETDSIVPIIRPKGLNPDEITAIWCTFEEFFLSVNSPVNPLNLFLPYSYLSPFGHYSRDKNV